MEPSGVMGVQVRQREKVKTKTKDKIQKNQRVIRGLSAGYWRQFYRRFSRQLGMSFYRQSAEGAKNGVVGEETPDE